MLGDQTDELIRMAAERADLVTFYELHDEGRLTGSLCKLGENSFERFCAFAADVLPGLVSTLPHLASEIADDIKRGNTAKLHTIREDGWIVATSGPFIADLRLIRKADRYISASPCYSASLNLDVQTLGYRRLICDDLLALQSLAVVRSERFNVGPQQIVYNDGINSAVICDEGEAMALCLTSLPLRPYDSIFHADTLDLAGKFQADPRDSAVAVALRVYAAARWPGGRKLATQCSTSVIRETRWAALNYFWRSNDPTDREQVRLFCNDPDAGIAAIAAQAIGRFD